MINLLEIKLRLLRIRNTRSRATCLKKMKPNGVQDQYTSKRF